VVEFTTPLDRAMLMRKNVEIVLNHALLNVSNDFTLNINSPSYKQKIQKIRDLRKVQKILTGISCLLIPKYS
jgi:hypothetical protein